MSSVPRQMPQEHTNGGWNLRLAVTEARHNHFVPERVELIAPALSVHESQKHFTLEHRIIKIYVCAEKPLLFNLYCLHSVRTQSDLLYMTRPMYW
jgi:hypothetical protein